MSGRPEGAAFVKAYHALEDAKFQMEALVNSLVGKPLSGRQLRVSYLLAKSLAHTDTLVNIIRNHLQFRIDQKKLFKWKRSRFFPFDHYSICALGRVCYDASLMLHYMSEPTLNLPQWNLRRKVLYLHDTSNRKRFLKAAGKSLSAPEHIEYDDKWIKDGLKEDIRRHLSELGIEAKPEHTNGQMVFLDGARGAVREAGWNVNQFEFQQVYLSNFIHTHPVSFMRASEHQVDFGMPSPAQFSAALVAVSMAEEAAKSNIVRCSAFLRDGGDPLAEAFDEDGKEIACGTNF